MNLLQNLDANTQRRVARSMLGDRADELTIIGTDADVMEGLEDLDIDFAEAIDGELFVGCRYNLRGVNIDLHVPASQFDLAERIASSNRNVWDVVRVGDIVGLRLYLRAYFSVRFRLDPKTLECSGYSVDTLDVR